MVVFYWLIMFFGMASSLCGEVRIQAEADKTDHFENQPVPVTIIVTHPASQAIDESSFKLGKEAIKADKVKDVGEPGAGDILSIYHYDLTGMSKGLHILPQMSVQVGAKVYKSVASTFEVKEAEDSSDNGASSSASTEGAFLKLENIVNGPTTLYPGQMVEAGYRYTFNANIETTAEAVPLFSPKGFIKVGDKVVNKKEAGTVSTIEVTQALQAVTPGVYQWGPPPLKAYLTRKTPLAAALMQKTRWQALLQLSHLR